MTQPSTKSCLVCQHEQLFQFKKRGFDYYRCTSCGLLSTFPLPDGATIEAHYAKAFIEGNYGLSRFYMKDYMRIYNDFVKKLEHTLQSYNMKLSGSKVLDIGCFTGELLELLQEKGADVYGLELQEEAVAIANRKLPGRVIKADVFSNVFPETRFDVIIMAGLIEHVVDPTTLLKRSYEMLRPGGVLMLQTPNSSSLLARMFGKYWPPCAPVEHIHLFSKNSIRKHLGTIGFKDISFKTHWKMLPIAYVYNNFKSFGQEFFKLLAPLYRVLPQFILNRCLPFYIGEFIVFARKDGERNGTV